MKRVILVLFSVFLLGCQAFAAPQAPDFPGTQLFATTQLETGFESGNESSEDQNIDRPLSDHPADRYSGVLVAGQVVAIPIAIISRYQWGAYMVGSGYAITSIFLTGDILLTLSDRSIAETGFEVGRLAGFSGMSYLNLKKAQRGSPTGLGWYNYGFMSLFSLSTYIYLIMSDDGYKGRASWRVNVGADSIAFSYKW